MFNKFRSLGLRVLFLALCAGAGHPMTAAAQEGGAAARSAELREARVTVRTPQGAEHIFMAEIADTAPTRNRGLMFRESLADDRGMLFIYTPAREAMFWMRNTLIPLDMIFIDQQGRVIKIHENAIPHDETPIPSGGVVRGVLEIRGGLARELGLKVGNVVRSIAFSAFWRRNPLDGGVQAQ